MGPADRWPRGDSDKLAFMAATGYALDAVLELSRMLADDDRNDIRIEAALAKLTARRWRGRWPTSCSRSAVGVAMRLRIADGSR